MRPTFLLVCFFALAASAFGQTKVNDEDAPEDMILGFRGKSKYQIVVPDVEANAVAESSVTRAAELLQQAFAANKITLSVVKESQVEVARPGFYLGATKFAGTKGVEMKKLSGWGYVHKVVGKDVIIAGNDEPDPLAGKRSTGRDEAMPFEGTLFGVAEFVHRYVGARFLSPDEAGTTFVPQSIIHVPPGLDVQSAPFFKEHDMRDGKELFYTANHARRFTRIWSRFGHQHPSAVPMKEYGKAHPEYFMLTAGVRQPALSAGDGQLCLSNAEVRELIYKHIVARCDDGFDMVELGQADGYRPCQCKECAALYGIAPTTKPTDGIAFNNDPAWGEKLWIMHRDMALRLMKDRPGKKILMTSYGPTIQPPKSFREFPENVVIEMMHSDAEAFAAWNQLKVPGGFSAYLYNWGNFHLVGLTPLTTVGMIAEQSRLLVSNRVHSVQVNGSPGGGQWGLEGPNIYVYLRLGIDPTSQSASELFDEYLQAAFRESENPMRRFFTNVQKRVELWQMIRNYAYQSGRDPIFALGTLWTPDVINALEEDLATAESGAQLPEVKRRLDIVRYEFDFLKHLSLVVNAWRNHQAMNNAASLAQVLDAVDARNAFIASIANGDAKYPKKKNPAYRFAKEGDLKYAGRYLDRAPFNWDTAKMRANPTALLQQSLSLSIERVSGPVTLESPLWAKSAEHVLQPSGTAEALKAPTSFRVLCDEANLYVRVSGTQPADRMNFAARGHDAELWLQESIVINVSPSGDRARYFYFAYEPEQSSFNEAEHGFITDYLHPRYGWNDEGWNGEWSFETKLVPAKNRWESMAVIPFETLRTKAPKTGDTWYLNVGRVHFLDDAGKKTSRELSVWSGKLNASHIPGDASFGKAIFK
ncbi:DUF4838 domain-containing protein [Prosthecobacter sp.]|uniref:DUF4838 domain-containing protein n=1 Tax=Prosthecobacter sp. TaxID=1965333 RepID=UPI00378485BD